MNREDKISRGNRAHQFLTTEVFDECMTDLLNEQFVAFLATDPMDGEKREKIHAVSYGLQTLQGKLSSWVDDMKIEKEKIKREKEYNKRPERSNF